MCDKILFLNFYNKGGGGEGQFLILANKVGRGVWTPSFLADIICEQPLTGFGPGVEDKSELLHHPCLHGPCLANSRADGRQRAAIPLHPVRGHTLQVHHVYCALVLAPDPADVLASDPALVLAPESTPACRTMVPCQDTPSVKATYTAAITAPSALTVLMSGIRCSADLLPICIDTALELQPYNQGWGT